MIASRFANVDATGEPASFVRYLDALEADDAVLASRDHAFARLSPRGGQRFVELGCGTGTVAARLAAVAGGSGEVLALDRSETMLAEARDRHGGLAQLRFETGDVTDVRLAPGHYDGVWIERVMVHVAEVERVLAAARACLHGGGRLVAIEPDWGTFVIGGVDRGLQRRWIDHLCTQQINGCIGAELPRLVRGAGLQLDDTRAFSLVRRSATALDGLVALERTTRAAVEGGALSENDRGQLLAQIARAAERDELLAVVSLVVVSAIA